MATRVPSEATDPDLEATAWDLEPLVDGEGPDGVERRLAEALERAQAFAARYAGKLGELDGTGLREAMTELADIHELVGRAGTYAALRFSTDTAEPANGALLQLAQERGTAIETTLLFFDLEWAALSDERAEELLAGEGLDFCRHHLRNVRRYRDHLLSEPEEKILAEKALTGASAWTRLFEELTSAIEVELPGALAGNPHRSGGAGEVGRPAGERVALDVALSRLTLADREVRRVDRGGRDGRAGAGAAHARVPVQHAARRQGDRRSPAPLSALAGGAQPRQRGQRRVGAGADRGRPRAL